MSADQLSNPTNCCQCAQKNSKYSGGLHQAERALAGFHEVDYAERLHRAYRGTEFIHAWSGIVLPFKKHKESLRRLEHTVDKLARLRPGEFNRDQWSFIIGWTENGVSNCFRFREAIPDPSEFESFSIEAEQRVGSESAIQTVEWRRLAQESRRLYSRFKILRGLSSWATP